MCVFRHDPSNVTVEFDVPAEGDLVVVDVDVDALRAAP